MMISPGIGVKIEILETTTQLIVPMLQPNPHHLCIKQVANDPKEAQGAKQPRSLNICRPTQPTGWKHT